jgi:hypothetical protein
VTEVDQIRSYQTATRRVRERLTLFARTAWTGLGSYRDADIDRLVDLIVPQVLAGQRTIAQLTDAYLSGLAGATAQGITLDAVSGTAVRGVPLDQVYRRPATTVYTSLSSGAPYPEAVAAGLVRLVSLVQTDMQLAQRIQEQQTLGRSGAGFYRRTLTGFENCALCILASTQRYHVGDLKPIHPGCDCGVAGIDGRSDPGQILNEELLETLHEQVGSTFGDSDRGGRTIVWNGEERGYKDILVREHGEYGPTLTWRDQAFTGPGDIAA